MALNKKYNPDKSLDAAMGNLFEEPVKTENTKSYAEPEVRYIKPEKVNTSKKADLHINVEFLSKNSIYFRNALVLSSLYSSSKPEYLLGMVSDCVTFKNINSNKYETIDGMKVEKYKYNNHTIEKIETINEVKDWKSKRKK